MKARSFATAFIYALISGASMSVADGLQPLSPAQVALFNSNHLKSIHEPATLRYSFNHAATGRDFSDTVVLGIKPHVDGRKDVGVNFLSGDRRMPFMPAMGFNGNPALMFFLEHDVAEMNKATGGSRTYFRNRIREAFVDRAELRPVSISYDGKQESGTEITLTPFRNDPIIARFGRLQEKSYRFVLSDAVPGTIYQIATTVPPENDQPSAVGDTMTFTDARACQGSNECELGLSLH